MMSSRNGSPVPTTAAGGELSLADRGTRWNPAAALVRVHAKLAADPKAARAWLQAAGNGHERHAIRARHNSESIHMQNTVIDVEVGIRDDDDLVDVAPTRACRR